MLNKQCFPNYFHNFLDGTSRRSSNDDFVRV